jgi:hypothetical protein
LPAARDEQVSGDFAAADCSVVSNVDRSFTVQEIEIDGRKNGAAGASSSIFMRF